MSCEFFDEPLANALVAASLAALSAKIMIEHGSFASIDGMIVIFTGLVVWCYGIAIALAEMVGEVERLKEAII